MKALEKEFGCVLSARTADRNKQRVAPPNAQGVFDGDRKPPNEQWLKLIDFLKFSKREMREFKRQVTESITKEEKSQEGQEQKRKLHEFLLQRTLTTQIEQEKEKKSNQKQNEKKGFRKVMAECKRDVRYMLRDYHTQLEWLENAQDLIRYRPPSQVSAADTSQVKGKVDASWNQTRLQFLKDAAKTKSLARASARRGQRMRKSLLSKDSCLQDSNSYWEFKNMLSESEA
jgi:hypothetical protein